MSRRCVCDRPQPIEIDAKTIGCAKCNGWFAVTISTYEELERFTEMWKL